MKLHNGLLLSFILCGNIVLSAQHNHHQPNNKQLREHRREHVYHIEYGALAIALKQAHDGLTLRELTVSKPSDYTHSKRVLSDDEAYKLIDQHSDRIRAITPIGWKIYSSIKWKNRKVLTSLQQERRNSIKHAHLVQALQKQFDVITNPLIISLIKEGYNLDLHN